MRTLIGTAAMIATMLSSGAAAQTPCKSCKFEKVATCGGFLEGPSVDKSGRLRVVDFASGDVLEVSSGKCTRVANSGGRANGSRLDSNDTLYLADALRGVLKMQKDGSFTVDIPAPAGPGQQGANDLAFDREGGLYYTVPGASGYSNRVGKVYYRAIGKAPVEFATGLAFPNGIAVSDDGKYVYVGQFSDKTILAIPSVQNKDMLKGDYVLAHTSGGIGPDGMILDSKKRIIWANFASGSIGVAAPDGTVLGNIPLPQGAGTFVTNIAEHDGVYYITEAAKGEVWKLTGLAF